jgi:hypothetical protein
VFKSGLTGPSAIVQSETDMDIVKSFCAEHGLTQQEALEKGLITQQGLSFVKTGKEIKAGAAARISKLKEEIKALGYDPECRKKLKPKKLQDDSPALGGELSTIVPEPGTVSPTENESYVPWDVRDKFTTIDRLELICRNIDPSKKFQLTAYDLQDYGL